MEINRDHTRNFGSHLADEIIANLRNHFGVDIGPVLRDRTRTYAQRRTAATRMLLDVAVNLADESADRAEWASPAGINEDEAVERLLAEAEVDIEPNIAYQQTTFRQLRDLQGVDVKDYLYSLTKRFENASKATSAGMMALEITGGAALSVGIPMAIGTIRALRAGQTLLAAVRSGITSIGLKTAVATIVIVLVGFLLWLIFENPKQCLGMVLNDTDYDLVVKDWKAGADNTNPNSALYMNHGSMKSFMQDYLDGDLTKKIQIKKRAFFGPDDPDNAVYAGIYFGDKNAGFYGAEGLMVFTGTEGSLQIGHLFAVPYSNDNGTNMAFLTGKPDMKSTFQSLYDSRQVRAERSGGGYAMTSTMDNARGGTVGCIATISQV